MDAFTARGLLDRSQAIKVFDSLAYAGVRLLAVGVLVLAGALWKQTHDPGSEKIFTSRNFYGVLTVYEHRRDEPLGHHFLLHMAASRTACNSWTRIGLHGRRLLWRGERGGFGGSRRAEAARRIGVVRSWTGTMAAFGERRLSSHLRNKSGGSAPGIVALYLPEQLPERSKSRSGMPGCPWNGNRRNNSIYFAWMHLGSIAIPVPFSPREAFEVYSRHLKTNGVIAVHIQTII